MNIYLTRHGQTLWNTEKRMQGMNNSPLTDEGREGAVKLGQELSLMPDRISRAFVSPLPRALHTAQLILSNCDYKIPLTIEKDLREMSLGIFEGMVTTEASKIYPVEYERFVHDPDNFVPVDGGETFADVIRRAEKVLNKLKAYEKEDNVLLISHMIMVEALLFASGTMDVENLRKTGPIEQTKLYKIVL